jgi:hypothetical protein
MKFLSFLDTGPLGPEEPEPGTSKKFLEYTFTLMLSLVLVGLFLVVLGLLVGPLVSGLGKILFAIGLAGLGALRAFDEWCTRSSSF